MCTGRNHFQNELTLLSKNPFFHLQFHSGSEILIPDLDQDPANNLGFQPDPYPTGSDTLVPSVGDPNPKTNFESERIRTF